MKLKKVFAVLITVCMMFVMLPVRAFAEDTILNGSGTEDDPYMIFSVEDWNTFADMINDDAGVYNGMYSDKYYMLGDDIGSPDDPVTRIVGYYNSEDSFQGTFDGNGKTLYVEIENTERQGTAPFRDVSGATIMNLTVRGTVTGSAHAGGLVGFNMGGPSKTTTIQYCDIYTDVTTEGSYDKYMGGVVGHNVDSGLYMECVNYRGTMHSEDHFAGGLVGWSDSSSMTLKDCAFLGTHTGAGAFHPIACKSASATVSALRDTITDCV